MEKALHSSREQFLLSSKGRLIGWGSADVKNLISNANIAITEKLKNKNKLTIRDAECLFAFEWFQVFMDKGITKDLVENLIPESLMLNTIMFSCILLRESLTGDI